MTRQKSTSPDTNTFTITLRVPLHTYNKVQRISYDERVSTSKVVRNMIDQYNNKSYVVMIQDRWGESKSAFKTSDIYLAKLYSEKYNTLLDKMQEFYHSKRDLNKCFFDKYFDILDVPYSEIIEIN